jgi:hypothetical protein
VRVTFLVPGPQDGAVAATAAELRAAGVEAEVASVHDAPPATPPDVLVATGYATALTLAGRRAGARAFLLSEMEDRRFGPDAPERAAALAAYALPVARIAAARWIAEQLEQLAEGPVAVVAPGVDQAVFAVPGAVPATPAGPLRIVVAGRPDDPRDDVAHAHAALAQMRAPHTATVMGVRSPEARAALLAEADVVLALPRLAGVPMAALEGFHRGATCVTTAVTGHEAYVADGENGLVTSWDDDRGTGRLLDLLAADRPLLARLRAGALETARAWPSLADSAAELGAVLRRVAADPVTAGTA